MHLLVGPHPWPAASDLSAQIGSRATLLAGRHPMKLARAGERICKVAGAEPLAYRKPGKLMLD